MQKLSPPAAAGGDNCVLRRACGAVALVRCAMAPCAVLADTVGMQFLERESPLASLAGYASDARRGEGRLVLVAGEAGVGKTTLVERLQADMPDARWSWGACDGLFTPRPLGPLFDLADQLGGALLESCRAGAARDELFRTMLGQVSEPGVLDAVVIEDVHWADEATIDLLRFVGRRIRDATVLIVVTYRDDALTAADPLQAAVGELTRQGSTRRIGLARLSAAAVGILASDSALEAATLYRLTAGNPFYVTEVLRAGLGQIPASARDAVLARAAPLSGPARTVLEVAALAGSGVELSLVQSVTACSPAAIDEVLASGLLSSEDGGLRFRHEIARLAVEQSVAAHRRGPVHARILDALRGLRCDEDARMAFHAEGAGDGPAVLRYARSAGRRAAELGAHREAAAQFERALRFRAAADDQRRPACMTRSPPKQRCLTGGRTRLMPASTRSRYGARAATGCGRATRRTSSRPLTGIYAGMSSRPRAPRPRWPSSSRSGRLPSWPGRTAVWPVRG